MLFLIKPLFPVAKRNDLFFRKSFKRSGLTGETF